MRATRSTLTPLMLLFFAFGTGASVACIYLNQPLLHLMGDSFGVTAQRIGLVATLTQAGYAAGIFLFVPLGDILAKKWLILVKLVLLAGALLLCGFSFNVPALCGASLLVGLFATAAQDFVPLTAELADSEHLGQRVGVVMSGLLLGILASRTLSGTLSRYFGWRSPFFVMAGVVLLLALLVLGRVPTTTPASRSRYLPLLFSLGSLVRRQPSLRLAALTHGLLGVAFGAFWTTLSFHLGAAPFHLSTAQIGTFGLAGVSGALAVPLAGSMADRSGPMGNILVGILLVTGSFSTMLFFPYSLVAIALGAVVFDLGIQMSLITHQSIIYTLEPAARSRINAVFVTGLFVFFAIGSLAASQVYPRAGWRGVLAVGLTSSVLALGSHAILRQSVRARAIVGNGAPRLTWPRVPS